MAAVIRADVLITSHSHYNVRADVRHMDKAHYMKISIFLNLNININRRHSPHPHTCRSISCSWLLFLFVVKCTELSFPLLPSLPVSSSQTLRNMTNNTPTLHITQQWFPD